MNQDSSTDQSDTVGRDQQAEYEYITGVLRRFMEVCARQGGSEELHAVLAPALEYARAHVQDEETVMAAVSYPELNSHRFEHEYLLRGLNELVARIRAGEPGAVPDTEALLRYWIDQHFTGPDLRFYQFLIAFHLRRLHEAGAVQGRDTALQLERERFHAIVEACPNAILVVDGDGAICVVNSQLERLFGYARNELLGKPVETLIPQRMRQQHPSMRHVFSESPEVRPMGAGRELYGLRRDGAEVAIEIGLSPLHTVEGRFFLASIIDISKRKEAERVMRTAQADSLRENILNNLPVSVIATDAGGRIVAVNPACEHLSGYLRDELVGQSVMLMHDPDEVSRGAGAGGRSGDTAPPDFAMLLDAMGTKQLEWTYRRKDGARVPVNLAITRLRDAAGNVTGFLNVASDITARKVAEASMRYMAGHDALTGLPNRAVLVDRLQMAIQHARRQDQEVAVLLLDLDQFKQVNDTLGHHIGDELLRAVAKRIGGCLRSSDTVSRLGGDEFVVVVAELASQEALSPLIGKIGKAVSAPLRVERHELHITASIGGCLCPRDGEDPATLLKKADTAMYRVKASGRGGFKWFNSTMLRESREKLELGNWLRHALELNEMHLHYQPKVSLRTGRVIGFEALMRWNHGRHGNIPPSRFIPVAEDSGLIVPLGEWALRTACRESVAMRNKLQRNLTVAVNVSPRQFGEKNWLQVVKSALAESGLNPNQLELEITESILMQNPEESSALLRTLRDLGVAIVIDDFGTGYSSLSYLTRFPIDKIKIDRSFVSDLATDAKDAAVINAIIAMAKKLNIEVVAEGVETMEQQGYLVNQTCDEAQGYYYAKGLPMDEFMRRLPEIEEKVNLKQGLPPPASLTSDRA